MMMFLKISTALSLILTIQCCLNEQQNWSEHLLKHINHDYRIHQVVTLIADDQKIPTGASGNTIEKIARYHPTTAMTFKTGSDEENSLQASTTKFQILRTSLFILSNFEEGDLDPAVISGPMNFISNMSQSRTRPKCLILLPKKNGKETYGKLLRNLWSHQFLDVTILEMTEKKDTFQPNHQELSMIQYYNPFTNITTRKMFRPKICYLPDKLGDMQRYPIRVGVHHLPPTMLALHDGSGNVVYSGLVWEKLQALSESMNFRLNPIFYDKIGFLNCTHKYESTGLLKSLIKKEIDISSEEFGRFDPCEEHLYGWSQGSVRIDLCLAVPFERKDSYSLNLSWRIVDLLVVISIPIIVWYLSHLFHFEPRNWRWTYIVQMILGSSVPQEPQRLVERIIFLYILFTCSLNSTHIFTAFTDFGLQKKSSSKYETIRDVLSNKLETVLGTNTYNFLYPTSGGDQKLLLEHARKIQKFPCIQELLRRGNVACLSKKSFLKWHMKGKQDDCGLPVTKILDECFRKGPGYTVLAAGSPYVERVDTIVQRLIESGVTRKWQKSYSGNSYEENTMFHTCDTRSDEFVPVLGTIFIIFIVGYSCSIVAFIWEMLTFQLLKMKARNFRMARLLRQSE